MRNKNISNSLKIEIIKTLSSIFNKILNRNNGDKNFTEQDYIKEFDYYDQYDISTLDKENVEYVYISGIQKMIDKEITFNNN